MCVSKWAISELRKPMMSAERLIERLSMRMPIGGAWAMRLASSRVKSSRLARGTTWLTMPHSLASAADRRWPVNRNSFALRMPITHGCTSASTEAAARLWPTGSLKKASSEAITRSHMLATMKPPAMHAPCTCAMVGLGKSQMRSALPR